jgi:hypothetical protein
MGFKVTQIVWREKHAFIQQIHQTTGCVNGSNNQCRVDRAYSSTRREFRRE